MPNCNPTLELLAALIKASAMKVGKGFSNMSSVRPFGFLAAMAVLQSAGFIASAQSTDFEFFKTRVEPIFLKHRETHGRCVTCHGDGGRGSFVLQPLLPGNTTWTEEQSQLNFVAASRLVSPGKPTSSQLLMHPLSPEAGGDQFHDGGHQFASQSDPDWLELATWVRQKPPTEYANLKVLKSSDNLMDVMRTFNLAFRSNCAFCHVATDLASDSKPTKVMARRMIQLTAELSTSFGKENVTCYTCHRGDHVPKTVHPRFPDLKPAY
jgi:cytochrome c553